MEFEARDRIRKRLDELEQTFYEKVGKLLVEQPNVYQEETAVELKAILTQMKDKMSEVTDRSAQREKQVFRLMELSRERVKRGDPLLREMPFIGMNKQSGLEENILREQWHGMRSAATEELHRVVVSPEVARRVPAVRALAGMEERLVIDEGPDTVVRLIEAGVESVAYYGGLEEIEQFARYTGRLISVNGRSLAEGNNRKQISQILSLLGIPPEAISASLEEFAAGLEQLAQAA